jgi:hypothetical protein
MGFGLSILLLFALPLTSQAKAKEKVKSSQKSKAKTAEERIQEMAELSTEEIFCCVATQSQTGIFFRRRSGDANAKTGRDGN